MLKAVAAGVTAGKSEDRFAPNDKITRQEICVMLNRVIEYVDQSRDSQALTNTSTQMDPKFTDSSNIDSWAVNSVALLTNNGWTWLTAVCTMLFSLMHWPCSTTCMTIHKETQSLKWTAVSFAVPTVIGMLVCLLVANGARLLGLA